MASHAATETGLGTTVISAPRIFDGQVLHEDHALVLRDGRVEALLPRQLAPPVTRQLDGLIAPAFLDLQVNGGGGHLLGAATDAVALAEICAAHRRLGCAGVMPTLITEGPEVTARVIALGVAAARAGVPGFLGLHLEGPHLDPRRKGAHAAELIRPMEAADLDRLCAAARDLPALIVTLAPEAVSPEQIASLSRAGVIVSLGHTDCSAEMAEAAFRAGARMGTHLFNAMSQLGHRSPGLVGALLASPAARHAHVGLIADGIHVDPLAMRLALAARPEGLFLVTDCMAFAGTDQTRMQLNGRWVIRAEGSLRLEDGTLAGADLSLDQAVARLVRDLDQPIERALAMASRIPAAAIGLGHRHGRLVEGRAANWLHLDADLRLITANLT